MILLGTIINAGLIILGTLIGRVLQNVPEKTKQTVMYVIGLSVTILGIQMGLQSQNIIVTIISLVVGAVLGEWWDLEKQIHRLGLWIESKIGDQSKSGSISQGFVTATLIFCVGSMAIIGAMDSGLRNDHDVLITKGIIDGFMSIMLATTLGIGVLFSAVPILVYQGTIAIFASRIGSLIPTAAMDMFIQELTATGGIMIIAIGLNLIGLTKIRVANLLPGILVVGVAVAIMFQFQ